ncbi:MAG: hypothetical protein MJY42_04410 [Bacteroidales bacterium]|nr:hypothetical protein [Bacteroidales bacterium]
MKTIEEMENLDLDAMIGISEDVSVPVPQELEAKVDAALVAAAGLQPGRRPSYRPAFAWAGCCAALAAACAALFLTVWSSPEDSFDDPALAYEQVEKTFEYISMKMNRGVEITDHAIESVKLK